MGATPLITTNNPQNTRSTKPDQAMTRTCSGFNGALLTFPVFQFAAGFAVEEVEQVTRLRRRVQR